MAINATPDSINTDIICRNLLPPVESKVSSTEIGLICGGHLDYPKNDQARHQGIHSHGRNETCFTHYAPQTATTNLQIQMLQVSLAR